MIFERGIWREATRNFWLNKWIVLLAVTLISAANALSDITDSKASAGIWVEFAWLPLAIAAHATVLKGTTGFAAMGGGKFKSPFSPFLWRSIGLSIAGIVPAAVFALPLLVIVKNVDLIIISILVFYGIFESIILAKWGTLLPASVAEGDKSFNAASARGTRKFGYAFGRFWGCNAVVLIVSYSLFAIGEFFVLRLPDASLQKIYIIPVDVIFTFLLAFNLVMLATILSRAYLMAEDEMKTAPALASAS